MWWKEWKGGRQWVEGRTSSSCRSGATAESRAGGIGLRGRSAASAFVFECHAPLALRGGCAGPPGDQHCCKVLCYWRTGRAHRDQSLQILQQRTSTAALNMDSSRAQTLFPHALSNSLETAAALAATSSASWFSAGPPPLELDWPLNPAAAASVGCATALPAEGHPDEEGGAARSAVTGTVR